jgi:hypothetical protein
MKTRKWKPLSIRVKDANVFKNIVHTVETNRVILPIHRKH